MNPRVKDVKPNSDYTLTLTFKNGEVKIYDVKPFLNKGVFIELQDLALFSSVKPFYGSIQWQNGQDICPDTLYIDGVSVDDDEIPKELNFDYSKARPNRFADYAESRGASGENLLKFAGTISPEDLEEMRKTIEEGCENIASSEWDFDDKVALQILEEIEDIAMLNAMKDINQTETVSENEVFQILNSVSEKPEAEIRKKNDTSNHAII